MSECSQPCNHSSHDIGSDGELLIPEKTSAWKEEDRENHGIIIPVCKAGEAPMVGVQPEVLGVGRPDLPSWLPSFYPGSTFTHAGWECIVRHVGFEGGMWMMLVEPQHYIEPRGAARAAFREASKTMGKKAAKKLVAEHRAKKAEANALA